MRYCPNPDCRHRASAGSQAEYLDHIDNCADCGSRLVIESGAFLQGDASAIQAVSSSENDDDAGSAKRQAQMAVMTGIFGILAGVGITVVTFALALNGGIYTVALGPTIFGVLRLLRGMEASTRN